MKFYSDYSWGYLASDHPSWLECMGVTEKGRYLYIIDTWDGEFIDFQYQSEWFDEDGDFYINIEKLVEYLILLGFEDVEEGSFFE
jgi:hypothetical protein